MMQTHSTFRTSLCFGAAVLAGGLFVNPVPAQHALGGGGALDANLGVGTGRHNAPTRVEDYRARNLVVTGNVAGGRGFRGTVGYGAEADFRGATGVDDLFRFRADSAYSAPALVSAPGWQQMRYGRELGDIALRRADGGVTSGMVSTLGQPGRFDEFRTQRPQDFRLRIDQAVGAPSVMLEREPAPRPVGMMREPDGQLLYIEASPLQGLSVVTPEQRAARLGLTPYDAARLRAESPTPRGPAVRAPGATEQSGFISLADPGRVHAGTPDARVRTDADPMVTILEQIARRYADRPDVVVHLDATMLTRLDEEYEDLRDRLVPMTPAERQRLAAERATQRMPLEDETLQPPVTRVDPESPDAPGVDIARQREPLDVVPPGQLERLFDALRHGERVDRLAPGGDTRFDELMTRGEQALRAGEYFDAERLFMRALRVSPGHPLAMVGAAHAQLGAGLQLPASLSIRRIMVTHPELIDARYGTELLPSRARLTQVADSIEARLAIAAAEQSEYGLALAYIGHHLEDRDMIERGLALMEAGGREDSLIPVLRNVWLAPR